MIGRAGPFGRDHGRPERLLRRAASPECRAFVRLLQSLEDQPRDALARRFLQWHRQTKAALGIECRKFRAKTKTACGDSADASPASGRHLIDLSHQTLGGLVAVATDGAP